MGENVTIQPRNGEGVIVTTIRLPVDVRNEVKLQANRLGRSFNTHVAMILKDAAGVQFGDHAPAAMMAQQNHAEAKEHATE